MTTWAASSPRANGTLMARGPLRGTPVGSDPTSDPIVVRPLTWGFWLERATGIEPA